MTVTEVLAVYGAIASTVAGSWQLFQYLNRGPKLHLSYSTDMQTVDNGQIEDQKYIVLHVFNRGTEMTTITHVNFAYYDNWLAALRGKSARLGIWILNGQYNRVPFELNVGSSFMAMTKQTQKLEEDSRTAIMYIGIVHTFSDKQAWKRFRPMKIESLPNPAPPPIRPS